MALQDLTVLPLSRLDCPVSLKTPNMGNIGLVVLACAWVSGQNIAAKADAAARTAAVVEETVDQGFAEELPAFSTQTLVPGPRPWHGGLFTLSARLVDGAGAGRCRMPGAVSDVRSCRSTGGAAGVRSTAGAGFPRRPRAPSHPATNSALHPATTLQTLAGARERRWMRPAASGSGLMPPGRPPTRPVKIQGPLRRFPAICNNARAGSPQHVAQRTVKASPEGGVT